MTTERLTPEDLAALAGDIAAAERIIGPRAAAIFRVADELQRQQELLAAGRFRYSVGSRINNAERLAILVEEVAEACAELSPFSKGLKGDARRIHLERMAANLNAAGNLARVVNDLDAEATPWVPGSPDLLAEVVQVAAVAIVWASALIAEGAA